MKKEILLNEFIDKKSDKTDNVVSLNLEGNYKLIQNNTISDTIDMYEQYNKERDNSNKFRISFTLYPIMTNILFNNITEIVSKEGSDKQTVLENKDKSFLKSDENYVSNITLTRINAIRNTEFSNTVHELSYHCGSDIFNNHFLKSKSFTPIIHRDKNESENKKEDYIYLAKDKIVTESDRRIPYDINKKEKIDIFNTLLDVQRDNNGKDIKSYKIGSNYLYDFNDVKKVIHIYGNYNTYDFKESFSYNISEKDGWIGFINKTSLKDDFNESDYFINKCINNSDSCGFVDMYPDRTLFSFSPKRNKYKKRYEYNWNYCLTYPYKNDYSGGGFLTEGFNGLPLYRNVNNEVEKEEYTSANGMKLTMFMSVSKHNLKPNDMIYFKDENGNKFKSKVTSIGDINLKDKEHYFSVKSSDFDDISDDVKFTHFSKITDGYECLYYFRKFKKIKYEEKVPNSSIKTLSFAKSIYGEEMSQILYTDDINIEGLKDNIGRPLSEIYLTIVKNNNGYKKWYNDNPNYSSKDVEYSHAFGKISSGLYFTSKIKNKDYCSICKQHNLPQNMVDNISVNESSVKIEDDITINNDEFFGDLVEYSQSSATETTIEDVYYRFNTGQREFYSPNSMYGTLFNDEIIADDYDKGDFKVVQFNMMKGYANINPEGYMYKPHHKVVIREFENLIKQDSDIPLYVYEIHKKDESTILFKPKDMNFISDGIEINLFLNDDFSKKHRFIIKSISDGVVTAKTEEHIKDNFNNPILFIRNISIPYYAHMLEDGTCRYLWRDLLKYSQLSNDSSLYDKPFTNGATYINSNIIMPLKRQDPFGEYDLCLFKNKSKYNSFLNLSSKKFEDEIYEIENENDDTTCW